MQVIEDRNIITELEVNGMQLYRNIVTGDTRTLNDWYAAYRESGAADDGIDWQYWTYILAPVDGEEER